MIYRAAVLAIKARKKRSKAKNRMKNEDKRWTALLINVTNCNLCISCIIMLLYSCIYLLSLYNVTFVFLNIYQLILVANILVLFTATSGNISSAHRRLTF